MGRSLLPERAPNSLCFSPTSPLWRAYRCCSQAETRHIFLLGNSPMQMAFPGEEEPRGATQLIGPSAPTRRSCVDSLMTPQHSITIAAPHRWADRMSRSGLSLSGGSAARRDSGGAEFGGGASSEVGAVLLIRPRHGERVQQCTVQNVVPGSAAMRCPPTSSPHHPRWKFLGHSPRLHG